MNDNTKNTTRAGITFTEALTLLFIALKLLNVIDWSWWWVLSPIWVTLIIAIIGIIAILAIKKLENKKRKK